ncbi:MAG: flagellar basal body-associated FliL family protein [Thermodesulfobacteriota bacterium]|jgi:flagellar FliL protein
MKENAIDPIQLTSLPSKPVAKEEVTVPQDKTGIPAIRKIKILIVAVAGFVLIGGGVGAALYLGWISIPGFPSTKKTAVISTPPKIGPMLKISPLVINLKEEGGRHYIKTTIVLEIGQKEWVEEVQSRIPLFSDLAILTLSDKRLEDLKNSAAKENLRKELLVKVNQALDSPKVNQIYFDEFLYQ